MANLKLLPKKHGSVRNKRDSLLIILEILKTVEKSPAAITEVVYRTNLNHKSAGRYLSLLSQRELVGVTPTVTGRMSYLITERGKEVLRYLEKATTTIFPN